MLSVGANSSIVTAFLVVFAAAALLNLCGLLLYRPSVQPTPPMLHRWFAKWEFSPELLGGFSYGRLALVSIAGLFFELLMIRWVSSEFRIFAYFKNFVLVACFLGFGIG